MDDPSAKRLFKFFLCNREIFFLHLGLTTFDSLVIRGALARDSEIPTIASADLSSFYLYFIFLNFYQNP